MDDKLKHGVTSFTMDLFMAICDEIACSSLSMKNICNNHNVSRDAFYAWIRKDDADKRHGGELRNIYARAKEDQTDHLVDEMLDIADDGTNDLMTIVKGDQEYEVENKEVVNRSRLRIDTRKFIASKLKPKKYGDKLDLTSGGEKLPSSTPSVIQIEIVRPDDDDE